MRLRYWLVATTAAVALSSGGAMAQGVAHPALWPAIKNPVAANPKIEARIKSIIARMSPDSWKALYALTLKAAQDGTLPMPRLNDAVARAPCE
jgi:hypothetical protein